MNGIQSDAGKYRTTQNEITGSRFSTPDALEVPSRMQELCDFIKVITSLDIPVDASPVLGVAAAHAWLAQIHPFTDGNGRSARALMNLILIRNRYLACIITEDDRLRYINALEESQASDLTQFVELVSENIEESLKEREWLTSLVTHLEFSKIVRIRDEYEIWRNALDHLKSHFKHTVDNINAMKSLSSVNVKFADYGALTIEKYINMRDGKSAKKTWYFGIEFNRGGQRARYLFFFGHPHHKMSMRTTVILVIAKNTDYGYERLQDFTRSHIPDIFQLGFDLDSRKFLSFGNSGVRERNLSSLVQQFFEQVAQRDFGG